MNKISSFIQRNNFLSSVLGSAVVVILFKLFDFLFLKSNLRFVDFIFLFLLLFIMIFLVIIYIKQKNIPTSSNEGKLKTDFDNHREANVKFEKEIRKEIAEMRQSLRPIYNKAKRYEGIDTAEEIIFILETIGKIYERVMWRDTLFSLYKKKFKFDSIEEAILSFNMNINWLINRSLIAQDQDEDEREYLEITDAGLEYLRIAKMKIEEIKVKVDS